MTPEERAAWCVTPHEYGAENDSWLLPADLEQRIAQAIREAVAEERAACAVTAGDDSLLDMTGGSTGNAKGTANRITAAIRARGEQKAAATG